MHALRFALVVLLSAAVACSGRSTEDPPARNRSGEKAASTGQEEGARRDSAGKSDGHEAKDGAKRPAPPAEPFTGGKGALLVGCTEYSNLPEKHWLVGPANDVELLAGLLEETYDFPHENIVKLSESQADESLRPTRRNILDRLDELVAGAGEGDLIVVMLAGHGSQQPDTRPDPENDPEPDGQDEIFLPSDINLWAGDDGGIPNAIVDDELRARIARMVDNGAFVVGILDCCHSGSGFRDAPTDPNPDVPRRLFPKDLGIPDEAIDDARKQAQASYPEPDEESRDIFGGEDNPYDLGGGKKQGRFVGIYAAQSIEPTIEKRFPLGAAPEDQTTYGLLTYTMNLVLARARTPMNYREVVKRIQQQYSSWNRVYPTPLIEGDGIETIFLGEGETPDRSRITLKAADDGTLSVDAGAVHGLTLGSILAILPPAGEGDELLGYVRVAGLRPLDATVEPIEYDGQSPPEKLPEFARARVEFVNYQLSKLKVAVESDVNNPGAASDLARQLTSAGEDAGSLVEVVDDPGLAEWLVQVRGEQGFLAPAAGVITAEGTRGAGEEVTLSKRFGPAPVDDKLGEWVRERVKRIARVENLLAMAESTAFADALDVEVTMQIHKDASDTEGEPVEWPSGGLNLKSGTPISFEIHNKSRTSVDVSLLFIDSGYGIHPFFPPPGRLVDVSVKPDERQWTQIGRVKADTTGLEHIVLIAVETSGPPQDFTWISQPTIEQVRKLPVQRGASTSTPLGQLFESAIYNEGDRRGLEIEAMNRQAIQVLSWRTLE